MELIELTVRKALNIDLNIDLKLREIVDKLLDFAVHYLYYQNLESIIKRFSS